jgi:ketosteroid isomerase-like protein
MWHPDAELHELADVPDVRVYHGHEGVREWLVDLTNTFTDLRFEPHEFTPHGDMVIVEALATARGRGSGVPLEYRVFFVFRMRGGKAVRVEGYLDRARALEAAGLTEETGIAERDAER